MPHEILWRIVGRHLNLTKWRYTFNFEITTRLVSDAVAKLVQGPNQSSRLPRMPKFR
jgi:hypothetical protein